MKSLLQDDPRARVSVPPETRFPILGGRLALIPALVWLIFPGPWALTSPAATPATISHFAPAHGSGKQDFHILFDGNSWVYGAGSTGGSNFPNQTAALLRKTGKTAEILNFGVSGQTIDKMQSDAVSQIDTNHATYDILIGLELVNQWGNLDDSKEVIYGKYKQYFLDRKAAGFKYVFACTPHNQGYYSRVAGGTWATVRAYFIAQMKAEFPALGIGVIDCGSDARLSNWTDTTYFLADKIHLNNAGQAVQAQYACDALTNITSGDSVVLGWTGTNTCAYNLQQTPALAPAAWANAAPYTNLTGLGAMAVTTGVSTNSVMFYRLISVDTN